MSRAPEDLEHQSLAVLLPSFAGTGLAPDAARLLEEGLAGLCLFGSNTADGPDAVGRLASAVRNRAPHAVLALDEEGGDVTRLHTDRGSPVLGPAALGAADDLDLTRRTGHAVGTELAGLGLDLDLGPVADVNSNPDNPVIGTRSFGTDPDRVAAHVTAWLGGLQAAGVAACVKHFPGHGDTGQDSHLALPVLDVDPATLTARELVPFTAAVGAGVAAVMTSHIVVPALDRAAPATLSPAVLSLLRDDLGFEGVIVTDALDMAGASAGRGIPEAAVQSLVAGADLLCLGPDKDLALVRAVQSAVVAAVREGRLAAERLHEAAGRVAALARVAATPGAGTLAEADLHDGAARSLSVDGRLPRLAGASVVSVDTPGTIAIGDVAWGLPADVVLAPGAWDALPDGPVVVQVRDAHRQAGVRDLLTGLAGREAVVVEWGWPGTWDGGLPRICARGWSRPGAAAVLDVLRTVGWDR